MGLVCNGKIITKENLGKYSDQSSRERIDNV